MRLSIPASGILSYSCWWLWEREKLVVGKRKGGKNQENFATASREREEMESAFPHVGLLLVEEGRGDGVWLVWSDSEHLLLGDQEVVACHLLWCPSALLLKAPHGITKLQVGHTAGTITPLADGDTNSETGIPRILTCRWRIRQRTKNTS